MRAFILGICAAGACAGAAVAADFDSWVNGLGQSGWTLLALNAPDKQAIFVRPPEAAPDGARTAWVRYEFMAPKPFGSVAALDKVDCSQRRIQRIKAVGYANNNLTGESVAAPSDGSWLDAPPGSLRDMEIQRACAVAARRR